MLLTIFLALILGIILGTLTGLSPGIHINLVSAILLSSLPALIIFSPLALAIFIVSMSITHTFVDFVPSIYLGCPDDSGLSVLPGHQLLLQGQGHKAVLYSLLGCLFAAIISIPFSILLIYTLPTIYPFLQRMMGWILIIGLLFMFSKNENKLWAFIIIVLAGFLGIASLNLPLKESLLPLLSGLFGSSTLIYSITQKTTPPTQTLDSEINKKELIKPAISTSIFSPLCAFLPGLGSSQAAVLSSSVLKKQTPNQFLFLIGSVNIFVMMLSFPALYSIDKARTGSAAAIQELMQLTQLDLIYVLLAALICSVLAFYISIKLSKIFARNISKINYSKLTITILIIVSSVVLFFSGWLGFLVYLTSTCLGLLTIYTEVRKSNLMSCLLIPTILYYLPV